MMDVFLDGLVRAFRLIGSLDAEVMSITMLTLKVSGIAVILSLLLGIPVALALGFRDFSGRRLFVNVLHTSMGLPPVVVGLFVYLLLSRNGWLGGLDLLYTPAAMIMAQVLMAVPIVAGVSLSAVNSVGRDVRETAFSLGATESQAMLLVLSEARRGIITSAVAAFGAAVSEVGAIIIVGGNIENHTRALTTAIVLETRRGNFELAMALGIILIGMSFVVNLILTYMQYGGARR